MYQVVITAAQPAKYSPTKFVNVAALVLATAVERKTAEWICEEAETDCADYHKMHNVLTMLYPDAVIGVGVRIAVTDIMPQG